MENRDVIEFYDGDTLEYRIASSMVPRVGDYISIRKKTWVVKRVTYAVDYYDNLAPRRSEMRANVDLEDPRK